MKITIITITYNAAAVVRPTLDSVFRQAHNDVEHWIIDGASTDDTLQIVEEYKRHDDSTENGHEVKILSEPDKGIYYAMNKGLERATGDYVLFLNAGDTLASGNTLDEVCASVGDGEKLPAVIYGDTDIVDANHNFIRHRRLAPPEAPHVAVVPSWHVGLSPGFLCPTRHCQRYTLRHPLPSFGRCRLVHKGSGRRANSAVCQTAVYMPSLQISSMVGTRRRTTATR